MNGVIVIDKPAGFTSFDVIAVVRKLTNQRKTGHTGTLDPNATGVLPVLLGSATRAQDLIVNHDKEYAARFRLGLVTDTLDIWGQIKSESDKRASFEEIKALLPRFTGEITQIPPMFSAIKQNGKRLYDLAREGKEVEREPRSVTVYELELTDFDEEKQEGGLKIVCSKGTYVRTISDDLGQALGTGAVMTALRRTSACGYTLSDSISLDGLKSLCESGQIGERLQPVESLFESYPALNVSEKQAVRFKNGGALDISRTSLRNKEIPDRTVFRVRDNEGAFLGLGVTSGALLKIYKLFINA